MEHWTPIQRTVVRAEMTHITVNGAAADDDDNVTETDHVDLEVILSILLFRKSSFHTLPRTSIILTEIFHGFSWYIHANYGTVL
jgi:hypothetical protein